VHDPAQLVDDYVAVWNEPDPARRSTAVSRIWTEDALHLLQPPEDVRAAAAVLRVTPVFQARGHAELEARVGRAYEEFVAPGAFSFRSQGNGVRLADAVRFNWEMVDRAGTVAAVGLELLLLAADGRVRIDYQFIET
jgi:hypothetical protein